MVSRTPLIRRFALAPSLICAALSLSLGGCMSGGGGIQAASPEAAMVYGHLDLPQQVREEIQWIHVYDLGEVYAPPFKKPPAVRFFPNGDFFVENVRPGKYYVHHVVAGFEAFYLYPADISEAKAAVTERAVEVKAGQLAYLGNHGFVDWKPGPQSRMSPRAGSVRFMSSTPGAGPEPIPNFLNHTSLMTANAGTFALKRTLAAADEKRVLAQVRQEVQGTGWDVRIDEKLRALR
jgi:hypothetical protein